MPKVLEHYHDAKLVIAGKGRNDWWASQWS
jgi:hypothetical protein